MSDLIRLAYISRSTQMNEGESHIQAINTQILSKSHTFNEANNITGMLCFEHGCYFQLIEGSKSAVELLYAKIQQDQRHEDIKLLFIEPIASRAFSSWQMKFIKDMSVAMPLVRLHGHKHFSPFEFSKHLFIDLVDFMSQKCAEDKC
jgi:hypothetical protein